MVRWSSWLQSWLWVTILWFSYCSRFNNICSIYKDRLYNDVGSYLDIVYVFSGFRHFYWNWMVILALQLILCLWGHSLWHLHTFWHTNDHRGKKITIINGWLCNWSTHLIHWHYSNVLVYTCALGTKMKSSRIIIIV